jgi:hypothetical protein
LNWGEEKALIRLAYRIPAVLVVLMMCCAGRAIAQVTPGRALPLGVNIDLNEQSLVDLMQAAGATAIDGSSEAVTFDANGWPTNDFGILWDNRYVFEWFGGATNIDPNKYSTNIGGTWKLSFNGVATVTGLWDTADVSVSNQVYNASTNTTTADVKVGNPAGGVFFKLQFTNTKRTAKSAAGTGLTNVRLIRPGYSTSSPPMFTTPWLEAVNDPKWNAYRFDGVLGTMNYAEPGAADEYPYLLKWTDRTPFVHGLVPTGGRVGWQGIPWEWIILIANQTRRDIWINIPVNASGTSTTDTKSYVYQLAYLLKHGDAATGNVGLNANQNIYVEYTNEPWHNGFYEGPWVQQAAIDQVNAGGSNLNYDGTTDTYQWRMRFVTQRTVQIGEIFKHVFSDNPSRIRPVLNNAWVAVSWANTDPDDLKYVNDNYGPPSNFLYGMSTTAYYSSASDTSIAAVQAGEMVSSDQNKSQYLAQRAITTYYGLHSLVYEGGEGETGNESLNPIWGPPVDPNLPTLFATSRDPGMAAVEEHDLLANWYPSGGDLYNQFTLVGKYSSYGFWGLSEDLTNLSTGKWKGVKAVMAAPAPVVTAGTALPTMAGKTVSFQPNPSAFNPTEFGSMTVGGGSETTAFYLLNASGSHTYSLTLTTSASQAGVTAEIWVDNVKQGTVSFPTSAGGSSALSVKLTPGLHTLMLFAPKPATSSVTISSIGFKCIR